MFKANYFSQQAVSDDLHLLALKFIDRNHFQINSKARKFRLESDEFVNTIFIFIVENWWKFNLEKGSLEAFVFGSISRKLKHSRDAMSRVVYFSDEAFERQQEVTSWSLSSEVEIELGNDQSSPGAQNLYSAAEAISSKSAQQIADELKITKRRVNQILKRLRDSSQQQYALNFGECHER